MSRKAVSPGQRWAEFDDTLREAIPSVFAWSGRVNEFAEIRVKSRDDGSTLAIAKGYDGDGTPVVAFGSGYGLSGALMALDRTLQGGNWRPDKFATDYQGGKTSKG